MAFAQLFSSSNDALFNSSYQDAAQVAKTNKSMSMSDVELEVVKDVDFTKGFDCWRFHFDLADVMEADSKHKLEMQTVTRMPDESQRKTIYNWRLRFDQTPVDGGKETYWIGLEFDGRLEGRTFTVLYRMAIWDENTRQACTDWGELILFRGRFDGTTIWKAIDDESNKVAFDLLKKESKYGLRLDLFLEIPISYCMGAQFPGVDVAKVRFEVNDEAGAMMYQMANIFENIVLHWEEMVEKEDDEVFASKVDILTPSVLPDPDFEIRVVDPKTKSERTFHCHRTILPLRSTYFAAMFRRRRRSTRSNNTNGLRPASATEEMIDQQGFIVIDDEDADTMEKVLRFIYTECVPRMSKQDATFEELDLDDVLKITRAVWKFGLDGWKQYCLATLLFDFVDDASRMDQYKFIGTLKNLDTHRTLDQVMTVCKEQMDTYAYIFGVRQGYNKRDEMVNFCFSAGSQKSWRFKNGTVTIKEKAQ